jgi:hypothetical protein
MDQLYLGYTGWEYAFMAAWFTTWIGVIYSYIRITDLKDQLAYYRYLNDLMIGKK